MAELTTSLFRCGRMWFNTGPLWWHNIQAFGRQWFPNKVDTLDVEKPSQTKNLW